MKHLSSNTKLLIFVITLSIVAGLGVVMLTNNLNQNIEASNLAYALMVVLLFLGIIPPIWRYWHRKDLFEPLVIYPVIYSVVFSAPVLYEVYQQFSGKALSIPLLQREHLGEMEFMALLGLIGLYAGLFRFRSKVSALRMVPLGSPDRLIILRVAMGLALLLQLLGIANYGASNWFFGIYGQGQFEYGVAYYLLLASQLLAYPAYLSYLCIRLSQRCYDIWMFLFPLIFAGLFFWQGGRGQALYFLLSSLVVVNYTRRRLKFQNIILLIIVVITLFVGSILSRQRTFDLSLLPNSFWDTIGILLGEISWAGNLTTAVIALGREVIPLQYGITYIGSIVNLIPGFVFGANWARLIPPPSLLFHRAYAPSVTDQGFGFSILAEAYINWGIFGAFPVMFVIGSLLGYVHKRIATGSYSAIVMYAIIVYQSLWYLRSDSLAFIKSVFYSAIVLIFVEFVHRLGTRHIMVGKRHSNLLAKA